MDRKNNIKFKDISVHNETEKANFEKGILQYSNPNIFNQSYFKSKTLAGYFHNVIIMI